MPITKKQRKSSRFTNAQAADMKGKTKQSKALHSMDVMRSVKNNTFVPRPPKKQATWRKPN